MEFVILYFSGTGNTELIATEIQQRLIHKGYVADIVSIEDIEKLKQISFEDKIIGFGYPIYKYSYPDIFIELFPFLESIGESQQYFQFATYARFTGYALNDFSKRLQKIGYRLLAEGCFKSPSCGMEARKEESGFDWKTVMFFENDIHVKLDAFVNGIIHAQVKSSKSECTFRFPPKRIVRAVVKDVEKTNYPKLQIDKAKCTVCGLCAKKCPDHNLVKEKDHISILDQYECLHCLRCMNRCSANAIFFGARTKGDNRYTLETRNRLYEKATSGYHENYWDVFRETVLAWRKNTLKYWRKHRNKPEV
jgi:NAD-dependent dihydropyrimidine dehydrogenase PreA subunit/flavodoxin